MLAWAGRMRAPTSVCRMSDLGGELDALASETGFSGVVRIDQSDRIELARAYGLAHRGFEIPNAVDTRFGLASGAKGFTALAVVSLIEEAVLELSTPARSVLGSDLPVIDDGVTVEHLLSHRSGVGDYLDEEAGFEVEEYVMPVPVHELATTEDYLAVLDGHASKYAPAERERSSPDGSSPRTGSRRWFGRAATRRNTRSATGWASGSTRRTRPSSWRGTTRVSRSGPCTIRAHA